MIFVRHPYSPPVFIFTGVPVQKNLNLSTPSTRKRTRLTICATETSPVCIREFPDELNGGETDEQQVKCRVSFAGQSHVFSCASSRSTCVFHFLFFVHRFAIAFFVHNISFSLSNALVLSFSSFLSQRWPKGRPSQVTNF